MGIYVQREREIPHLGGPEEASNVKYGQDDRGEASERHDEQHCIG